MLKVKEDWKERSLNNCSALWRAQFMLTAIHYLKKKKKERHDYHQTHSPLPSKWVQYCESWYTLPLRPQVLNQFRFYLILAEIQNFQLADNNNCFSKISNELAHWKQKLLTEAPWCDRKWHWCFFHCSWERSIYPMHELWRSPGGLSHHMPWALYNTPILLDQHLVIWGLVW